MMPSPQQAPQKQQGAGDMEAQLIAMIRQAKQIAEENRIDFTVVIEKALGGISQQGQQLPPPPPSVLP